jgi:hypothetical protein
LAEEVKKEGEGKSLQKLIEVMAPKVQQSIAENNLDVPKLMNSAKQFAKQNNPQAAQMFGGIDPFAMLERMAGGQMTEQQCKKKCDKMMKNMNMGGADMSNMMNMMQQQSHGGRGGRGRGRRPMPQKR